MTASRWHRFKESKLATALLMAMNFVLYAACLYYAAWAASLGAGM